MEGEKESERGRETETYVWKGMGEKKWRKRQGERGEGLLNNSEEKK